MAALVLPAQAMALSCMRFDPVAAFAEAQASKKSYLVVRGSLDFDNEGLPESYQEDAPEEFLTSGHVTGMSLSSDGFATPFEADVVVVIECYGPWCATAQKSDDALMFVRVEAAGAAHYLDLDPCSPMVFTHPEEMMFDAMEDCLAGDCPASAE